MRTKKVTYVLVVFTHEINARAFCEFIQNNNYTVEFGSGCEYGAGRKLLDDIIETNTFGINKSSVDMLPISDFMDEYNNDSLMSKDTFITYVNVEISYN